MSKTATGYITGPESWVNVFFIIYLVILPFNINHTVRYIMSSLLILCCFFSLKRYPDKRAVIQDFRQLLRKPIFWGLVFLIFTALVSVLSSPEPDYSIKVFLSEFFLNILLFLSLLFFVTRKTVNIEWAYAIKAANIIFITIYLSIMLQWVLFPDNPLFIEPGVKLPQGDPAAAIFMFGNACSFFHGIIHTSMFLGLMISFQCINVLNTRFSWGASSMFILDIFTLISTTRRAATLAAMAGTAIATLFYKDARKFFAWVVLLVTIMAVFIVSTGSTKYFIREDWKLILHGDIEQAKEKGGSIPLRVSTYREFIKEIVKSPFIERGLGRKLIKKYHAKFIARAGLYHGHNTFLNYAFYMGIQGMFALILIILAQGFMYWKCWKESRETQIKMLMAVSLVFLVVFWGTNMFTDGFRRNVATLYWLFSAVPTGIALRYRA